MDLEANREPNRKWIALLFVPATSITSRTAISITESRIFNAGPRPRRSRAVVPAWNLWGIVRLFPRGRFLSRRGVALIMPNWRLSSRLKSRGRSMDIVESVLLISRVMAFLWKEWHLAHQNRANRVVPLTWKKDNSFQPSSTPSANYNKITELKEITSTTFAKASSIRNKTFPPFTHKWWNTSVISEMSTFSSFRTNPNAAVRSVRYRVLRYKKHWSRSKVWGKILNKIWIRLFLRWRRKAMCNVCRITNRRKGYMNIDWRN